MTIYFRVGDLPPESVRFAPSPAQEALQSLYVLYLPKRFPLHTHWVLRTRRKLSAALKAELEFFEPMWGNGAIPLLWDGRLLAGEKTFEDQLNWAARLPLEEYKSSMLAGLQVEVADPLTNPDLLRRPFVRTLKEDPTSHRERFLAMFRRYWEEAFQDEWLEVKSLIAQDIERRSNVMLQKSVLHGLVNLSRFLLVNFETGTATVTYNTVDKEVLFPPDSHLYLMPSYFTWPFLFLAIEGKHPLISYPLMQQQEEGHTPVPPERLLQLLKATGDATRLQILQLLVQEPRSTRQLAGLIRISEATVSKHLKQLHEADLITPKRDSHYVFYHLVKSGLTELTHGLSHTFQLQID